MHYATVTVVPCLFILQTGTGNSQEWGSLFRSSEIRVAWGRIGLVRMNVAMTTAPMSRLPLCSSERNIARKNSNTATVKPLQSASGNNTHIVTIQNDQAEWPSWVTSLRDQVEWPVSPSKTEWPSEVMSQDRQLDSRCGPLLTALGPPLWVMALTIRLDWWGCSGPICSRSRPNLSVN